MAWFEWRKGDVLWGNVHIYMKIKKMEHYLAYIRVIVDYQGVI